jgi:hypothetical protein
MTKLCPRGKAAAKRKFKVYPSAYANAYASKICAGKIKDPSGVKRKDFRGSKAEGGLMEATARLKRQGLRKGSEKIVSRPGQREQKKQRMGKLGPIGGKKREPLQVFIIDKDGERKELLTDTNFKKGGRAEYRKGGGVCLRGMNRDAVGKNS